MMAFSQFVGACDTEQAPPPGSMPARRRFIMRRLSLTALLFSLVVAVLAAQASAPQSLIPRFEAAPCPFEVNATVSGQLRCGYVTVLENRSKPDGRRLRLAVVVLKSFSRKPRPDPVVRLAGGPGEPHVARALSAVSRTSNASELIDTLRRERDVILYDQRGVGFSEPEFCPDEAGNWRQGLVGPARTARRREVAARCGDAMRRLGFDLSQYNSAANALDLQDIRRALGHEQWNVYGHSYGTRLALVAMRDAAEGIRSVILSGPYPTSVALWYNVPGWTHDVATRVLASCAAQPACRAAFPDVEQAFRRTIQDLERNPWTRQGRVNTVTAATFTVRLQDTMKTPRGLVTIPLLVHAMSTRNEAVLNALARRETTDESLRQNEGLHHAVQCFEEAPLNTAELKERMRRSSGPVVFEGSLFADPSVCEGMHSFRASDAQTAPVESAIPTLIVTGEFDPQTHRSNGPIVQRTLKNSQLVDVPSAGHIGMFAHRCTQGLAQDFLNAPLQRRDTSCLQAIPPIEFVTEVKGIVR
jgi:pimeloyl-ACP methyl ester carboxylesterase